MLKHATATTIGRPSVICIALLVGNITGGSAQQPAPAVAAEREADEADSASAAAIIVSSRGGDHEALWRSLRRDADPGVRAYVIDRLGVDASVVPILEARLPATNDPGERAALILALGGAARQTIAHASTDGVKARLRTWYARDPDAEVHSAIEWLWRRLGLHGPLPSPAPAYRPGRRWLVNVAGETMVVVTPSGPFVMGAPETEPRSDGNERPHSVRIPRTFAISSEEVTVAQFQEFLIETGGRQAWLAAARARWPHHPNIEKFWSYPDQPQFAVTWYEAARYCNWLSLKAGLPRKEWVYPDTIAPGMKMPADYLRRTGYRLPTEAEWEFAARAGTSSAHFFGDGVALLDRFAWYLGDSDLRGWPVGTKWPNQLGMFDMYGNAWEWLQDRWIDYPTDGRIHVDVEDTALVVNDDSPRIRRGGSYTYDRETTRSAHRGAPGGYRPPDRRDSVGFRVARTLQTLAAPDAHLR